MKNYYTEGATLGLHHNAYKNHPSILDGFLNEVEKLIVKSRKTDIPDDNDVEHLRTKLNELKGKMDIDFSKPEPIAPRDCKKIQHTLNDTKSETMNVINKLGKLRKLVKYGDNAINSMWFKPKVYQHTTDEEKLTNVNKWVKVAGIALDYAEKYSLDILNAVTSDINLMELVERVYYKKIFEQYGSDDIMDLPIDYEEPQYIDPMLLIEDCDIMNTDIEIMEAEHDTVTHPDDKDIVNMRIKDNDEEYFPLFAMAISYDREITDPEKKKLQTVGNVLNTVSGGEEYTHAIVSFDPTMKHIYHYLKDGFVEQGLADYKEATALKSLYISAVFLTKDECESVMKVIKDFKDNKSETKYSFDKLIKLVFGKASHTDKRLICSSFVAYLLMIANPHNISRDYALTRPEDITLFPKAFFVGSYRNSDDFFEHQKEFEERVMNIYEENIDSIREYNNIIPKVMLKDACDKCGTIDKVVEWFIDKLAKKS